MKTKKLLIFVVIGVCVSALWAICANIVINKTSPLPEKSLAAIFAILFIPHVIKILIGLPIISFIAGGLITSFVANKLKLDVIKLWHHKLLSEGDTLIAQEKNKEALERYLQAMRMNEKYSHDESIRLSGLEKLLSAYEHLNDNENSVDVRQRIEAIKKDRNIPRYQPLTFQQVSKMSNKIRFALASALGILIINTAIIGFILPSYGLTSFVLALLGFASGAAIVGYLEFFS